jgi:hypothetical protein
LIKRPPAWLVLELVGTVGVFSGCVLEFITRKDVYLFVITASSFFFALGAKMESLRHYSSTKKEVK